MFIEIVEAGGAALSLFENRQSILRVLKRFQRRIFRGVWRVAVFGDGGTGKTTLGRCLAGEFDTDTAISGYRETIDNASYALPGDVPCVILVPPGQERRRPHTWPNLYRLLAEGRAGGIINVVSWGYHSTELEYGRHLVFKKGMTEPEFLEAYLKHNRIGENRALHELVPHLKAAKGKLWMITLVTKQDLWWTERHSVERHYKEGEYQSSFIDDIIRTKGMENFSHNYYSVSLIPENLTTKDGQILATTVAGYDQPLRIANLTRFMQGLNDLIR